MTYKKEDYEEDCKKFERKNGDLAFIWKKERYYFDERGKVVKR